jgi:hypothetical protein
MNSSVSRRGRRWCFLAVFAATSSIAAVSSAQEKDGARFRGGVSAAFGGLFGSEGPASYSGILGGADGHLGVQINNLIGVYAVPHLSYGSITAEVGSISASDGWLDFSGTGVVDVTLFDRFFVGGGAGFAAHAPTCTNCGGLAGPNVHLRLGGYPLMSRGDDGIRRKGLMIGADLRINFLSDAASNSITLIQPMVSVGYEAF